MYPPADHMDPEKRRSMMSMSVGSARDSPGEKKSPKPSEPFVCGLRKEEEESEDLMTTQGGFFLFGSTRSIRQMAPLAS